MHIKELVLDDFKSFGRKTRIPFYDDFTTVSGPNGSGKSNIIDAVLFALGLARTRGIRAEKLTDLIYNPGHDGDAAARSGPREASVEVVLDNADGTLSRGQVVAAAGTEDVGDVGEVSIRRRVKETDDNYYSYYYLNGRSVNLSDIRDLLAQAGVAPEGYNVVMQGDVTEIINMTPAQRREIIDEIAGVAEFDEKRAAAFEELEAVEDRIDEAELRIEEKQQRLDQLADERETAMEYQGLRDEKAEHEGYLKAAELAEKREDLAETRSDVAEREAELAELRAELDEREGRVSRLQDDLAELNAEIERKGEDEQLRLKGEIEEIKGEIARVEDAVEACEERIEEAEQTRREAFVEIDRKQETVEELASDVRETKLEKASVKSDVQQAEAELADVEAEIDAVDAEYEELKEELADRKAELEAAKTEKNDLQRRQDRLLDEARRRSEAVNEVETAIDEAREELPELDAERSDLEDELAKARENRERIETVVEDLKADKRSLQDDLAEVEDDLKAAQQEYAELEATAAEDGDTSFPRSVRTVLEADVGGVHGAVGQLGGVEERYATACETAAGGRLANVVVDDDAVGQECIELLKARGAGRATFLPLSELYVDSLPDAPDHPGVVDFAYELVDFDEQYAAAFSYVLGDTLVVEDLDVAREFMGQYRLVTLEGDLVEKSGAMTGGSKSGSRFSFSKTGPGRLERVADHIAELEGEREDLRSSVRDVEERLEDARDRQTDAADQVRSIESDVERVEARREDVEQRIEDHQSELEDLRERRAEVDSEMQAVESEVAEKREEIADLEAEVDRIESDLSDSRVPELTARAEEIEAEIAALEDQLDDLDAELNELQLEKRYAEEAIDDRHDDIEAAQNRKTAQQDRIEELREQQADEEQRLADKREQVAEIEAELSELKDERADLKAELADAEAARDEKADAVATVENRLDSLRRSAERLELDVEELEAAVEDHDPEAVPDHDEVRRTIDRLERQMEALEPVNMLAIEEYDEVEADLNDLQERKTTLADEQAAIRERIDQYEARKKATFMEAYEAIDANFREIFQRLSNGTGRLHLEDEADPFAGGLTMKAEPGDKPVQRLDAMSGGEKSLTALAFIFAIQRHNPAPFYALDEVDAFLDAANAERVGEMVDELAREAQFVVVSHRSAMLERSERAIGVTMQDDNVSAVTGIDLAGVEASADD